MLDHKHDDWEMRRHWRRSGMLVVGLMILVACSAPAASVSYPSSNPLSQPSWTAPVDPMGLADEAGLVGEPREYLTTHTHAHLDVFVDGTAITVPAGIGIDLEASGVTDTLTPDGAAHFYAVHVCPTACLSPLHTHDPSGLIHTESRTANRPALHLGQFFTEWGLRLDASCVGEYCKPDALIHIYVNGTPYDGNPAEIPLASHVQIAIVIGQPPTLIPSTYPFDSPT